MKHKVSDYYDGSRMLSFASDYFSMSIDQFNFTFCQIVALILATCFRSIFHPSKVKPYVRHLFGLIFGLIIGYHCFGFPSIHLIGLPSIGYLIIKTQNPKIMQKIVLIISLLYLSIIHLHRQIYDYGSYSLDVTGPLMVITQKVTSIAFNLHDGLTKKKENMTKNQQLYALNKIPNILEYFSFCLQFPTILAGPTMFYKDYKCFIEGDKASMPLSPMKWVIKKLIIAIFCALIFLKLLPLFPISHIKDKNFVEQTSLIYKFWFLIVCTTLVRFKYYFAWNLADAVSINCGMGFNGFTSDNKPKWNKISNVDIIKFEFGRNLRESIEAWNIGTNKWLRTIVYERVSPAYSTILTYLLSAFWHGFYPGYYITFANGALFTFAARIMRRKIRNFFQKSFEAKIFYDIITILCTRLVLAYITFTFVLLEFTPGIYLYIHMYCCLHIIALIAVFIVPKIIPNECTRNNIAQTFYEVRPITNGVS